MSALVQEFKTSVTSRIDLVLKKIETYEENNRNMKDAICKLSTEVDRHSKELAELRNLCQQCMTKTYSQTIGSDTSHTVSSSYQYNPPQRNQERGIKRNNIIIAGLDIGAQDPKIFFENFLTAHFPAIKHQGILAIQQLPTPKRKNDEDSNESEAMQKYLVTMKSCWDAQLIYSQRVKQLKNKNIYISEDLTSAESNLFYKARQLKKNKIVHSTWTKDGKTFVRRTIGDDPIELNIEHPLFKEPQPDSNEIIQQLIHQIQATSRSTLTALPSVTTTQLSTLTPQPLTSAPQPSTSTVQSLIESDEEHNSTQEQKSEEDLRELLQGALTRATDRRRKKKTNTKTDQNGPTN